MTWLTEALASLLFLFGLSFLLTLVVDSDSIMKCSMCHIMNQLNAIEESDEPYLEMHLYYFDT